MLPTEAIPTGPVTFFEKLCSPVTSCPTKLPQFDGNIAERAHGHACRLYRTVGGPFDLRAYADQRLVLVVRARAQLARKLFLAPISLDGYGDLLSRLLL